jgi:hypothetical protein
LTGAGGGAASLNAPVCVAGAAAPPRNGSCSGAGLAPSAPSKTARKLASQAWQSCRSVRA